MLQLPDSLIISRTDNLGDVILTLPLAGYLKSIKPTIKIFFIGKAYTKPVIEASRMVDVFLDREELLQNPEKLAATQAEAIIFVFPDKEIAKIAHSCIPIRIGTSHRLFHWLYCNKLVNFSRKNSDLHEAQLNCKLLKPFGIAVPSLETLANFYGIDSNVTTYPNLKNLLKPNNFHLIIHPKSKGSAREWKIENYYEIIKLFRNTDTQIFITGVATEGQLIREQYPQIFEENHVTDLTGKLNLTELIAFIGACDALLACSTGTLHIAAAVGIHAIGLYPPMKPIHPQRWKPIGKNAQYVTAKEDCNACRKTLPCVCMQEITPKQLYAKLVSIANQKTNS